MFYRVLKDGFKHPHSQKPLKKGEVIDLFHLTGNPLTKGKDPVLVHTKKVDKNTAMVLKERLTEKHGLDETEESTDTLLT